MFDSLLELIIFDFKKRDNNRLLIDWNQLFLNFSGTGTKNHIIIDY